MKDPHDSSQPMAAPKFDWQFIHLLVAIILMFGFKYLPPISVITAEGMAVLGIFLGLIYGWSTSGMFWPSLLGMLALGFSGSMTMTQVLQAGFGSDTLTLLIFLLPFIAFIEASGMRKIIVDWFMSRKISQGRPWVQSFMILLAAYVASILSNALAVILIFLDITYGLCRDAGIKPYDKYPTLMSIGIVIACSLSMASMPFKPALVILIKTFQASSGITVSLMTFMFFSIPLAIVLLGTFILACKFIFKADVSALQTLQASVAAKLTSTEKISFFMLFIFLLGMTLPSILPKQWAISTVLANMGTSGVLLLLTVVMVFIKINGKPLYDFQAMARNGIQWQMIFLSVMIMPISNALLADNTGIKQFVSATFGPMVSGLSAWLFVFAVVVSVVVLTNFFNNMVIAIVFLSIVAALAADVGANSVVPAVLIIMGITLAILTPAASPLAAFMHGQTAWLRPKDIYWYSLVTLIILMAVLTTIGYAWARLLF